MPRERSTETKSEKNVLKFRLRKRGFLSSGKEQEYDCEKSEFWNLTTTHLGTYSKTQC